MRSHLVCIPKRSLRLVAPFLLVLAGAAGIGLAVLAAGAAGSPPPDRLHRQVGVMEGIIDKVLLDSPNFVVSGRDDTRGVVLPDYGIVFSFNASINSHDIFRLPGNLSLNLPFDISTGDDGAVVVGEDGTVIIGRKGRVYSDDSADGRDEKAAKLEQKAKQLEDQSKQLEKKISRLGERLKGREQSIAEWNKQSAAKAEELYAAGKQELLQVLLDYGETMTSLKDGQWIVLAGFFDRGGILEDKKVSRLVLRVKIDELRAYSAGRLSEAEARDRIIVEEY
jgi:hypothetical protein